MVINLKKNPTLYYSKLNPEKIVKILNKSVV